MPECGRNAGMPFRCCLRLQSPNSHTSKYLLLNQSVDVGLVVAQSSPISVRSYLAMVVHAIVSQANGHSAVVLRTTPGGKRVRPQSDLPNGTSVAVVGKDGVRGSVRVCTLTEPVIVGWAKASNFQVEGLYPGKPLEPADVAVALAADQDKRRCRSRCPARQDQAPAICDATGGGGTQPRRRGTASRGSRSRRSRRPEEARAAATPSGLPPTCPKARAIGETPERKRKRVTLSGLPPPRPKARASGETLKRLMARPFMVAAVAAAHATHAAASKRDRQ